LTSTPRKGFNKEIYHGQVKQQGTPEKNFAVFSAIAENTDEKACRVICGQVSTFMPIKILSQNMAMLPAF
jgi:hypothetical protein